MEWSKIGCVVLTALILLSKGMLIESTKSPVHGCKNPNILLSYLDLDIYNTTNPYIDFHGNVVALLDLIAGRDKSVSEYLHDLVTVWSYVCKAEDLEKETTAWKDLANEIHHRLHSDQSLFNIVKMIFGDRMVPWIMNPPPSVLISNSHYYDCIRRLSEIFVEHCGSWYSFGLKYYKSIHAMCTLGVGDDEFAECAKETCQGYVYTPHPIMT